MVKREPRVETKKEVRVPKLVHVSVRRMLLRYPTTLVKQLVGFREGLDL